ncbi:MAG: EpsG family protein [Bacilli bacterium]|nr:EpsG family protein [Bacilli bacterium]
MKSLLVYIFVFFIVFILNIIGSKLYHGKKNISRLFILISFLILLALIGFRYYVGTDYESYIDIYNKVATLEFNELYLVDIEYGTKVIFKIIYNLFDNQYYIFIALGLVTLYPIYKANKLYDYEYLPFSVLTFCLMFLPFDLNGMRQGVAMSFIILSFAYLFKDKKIMAFISFAIAFLFHKSAILLLPYLGLFMIKKGKSSLIYSISFTLILSFLLLFFNDAMMRLGIVSDYEYLLSGLDIDNITYKNIILYIPFIFLIIVYDPKVERISELKGLFISSMILLVLGTSKQYLSRISLYHMMFLIILIPMIIKNINNKTYKYIIEILYIIYLLYYFIHEFYTLGIHEIFPYQTWVI